METGLTLRHLEDWLQGYLAFTSESPAPECFHRWVGLGTLGAVLKRNIFYDRGYSKIYPNNYVVLIGPPGSMKSTAMDIGKDFARGVPDLRLSVDSTSREQLIYDLQKDSATKDGSMACFAREFGSFFATSEMNMVLFLIEVYDSKDSFEHRSRSGGNLKIERPCFNIVGCTTPEWLHTGLPIKTLGIGLMSRVILIYADAPRFEDLWTSLTPSHETLRVKLQEDLNHIAQLKGPVHFTDEARAFLSHWNKIRKSTQSQDPRMQGFYGRIVDHTFKTAIALSAGRSDSLVVQQKDVEDAIILLGDVESTLPQAFAASGKNPFALDYVQVHHAIVQMTPNGGATRSQLMRFFQHNVRQPELVEVLSTLEETGAIRVERAGGIAKYLAVAPAAPHGSPVVQPQS